VSGLSDQVCGLSIVCDSGVGQPLGHFSLLPGDSAGRADHVTAMASATIARPITVATTSS
jgi:hypothetical protein